MNIILSAASCVVIVVALEVLSAMRPGITPWVHFPTWLAVAMSAFFLMVSNKGAEWFEVMLVVCMAGMLWRYRRRFAWEAAHRPRDDAST